MTTEARTGERSLLTLFVGTLAALGLLRVAGRFLGFFALLGVVAASVAALTVGILVLRLLVLH